MLNYIFICILILLMGSLGGVINYLLHNDKNIKFYHNSYFGSCIIVGIGAAIIVPLFLNTISSNLIRESITDVSKLFILAGFFLLASIFSEKFINSIWKKIIKDVEENKKDINRVNENIAPIIDKETEIDDETEIEELVKMEDDNEKTVDLDINSDSKNLLKILKCLVDGEYTYRSISGIAKSTNLNISYVKKTINSLINRDYVSLMHRQDLISYCITPRGRRRVRVLDTEDSLATGHGGEKYGDHRL